MAEHVIAHRVYDLPFSRLYPSKARLCTRNAPTKQHLAAKRPGSDCAEARQQPRLSLLPEARFEFDVVRVRDVQ